MRLRWIGIGAVAAAAVAAAVSTSGAGAPAEDAVARVVDGDTIALADGRRVRLLQIDAPELRGGECYARAARAQLARLLPPGTRVRLERDPRLDAVDRYGRALAYVWKGREHVNRTLVLRGAASVWFYERRGRHAARLLAAARKARAAKRGLWGACPGTRLDPSREVETSARATAAPRSSCDRSYPGVCIAPPPPDLDCGDVPHRGFRVAPPDPHRFDRDRDGVGCEP